MDRTNYNFIVLFAAFVFIILFSFFVKSLDSYNKNDAVINEEIGERVEEIIENIVSGQVGEETGQEIIDEQEDNKEYRTVCLTHKQAIPSMSNRRYVCNSELCQVCVSDRNVPVHPGYCRNDEGCSMANDRESLNKRSPFIEIFSPLQGKVYDQKRMFLNVKTDEESSLYYLDNKGKNKRYKKISGRGEARKMITASEGVNNLSIKAVDKEGNIAKKDIVFYVDSRRPRVRKVMPVRGFYKDGIVATIEEENLVSLVIIYEGYNGMEIVENIDTEGCEREGRIITCKIEPDYKELEFSEKVLKYRLIVTDITNASYETKTFELEMDNVYPRIINENIIKIDRQNVYFRLEIEEDNFRRAMYVDRYDPRKRQKTLCNRLQDHKYCEKMVRFSKGRHNIEIIVTDSAGNTIAKPLEFQID